MKINKIMKIIFYLTLLLAGYFVLVFTGVVQSLDSKLIGALFELITIPLILMTAAIFLFCIYQLVSKHVALTFYPIANILVSGMVILSMFLVP